MTNKNKYNNLSVDKIKLRCERCYVTIDIDYLGKTAYATRPQLQLNFNIYTQCMLFVYTNERHVVCLFVVLFRCCCFVIVVVSCRCRWCVLYLIHRITRFLVSVLSLVVLSLALVILLIIISMCVVCL